MVDLFVFIFGRLASLRGCCGGTARERWLLFWLGCFKAAGQIGWPVRAQEIRPARSPPPILPSFQRTKGPDSSANDTRSMMHVGRGRQHPLHVEYMHIGALLSFIQDVLNEAILSHPRLHMNRKIALVKALGKVIWIQNDLFAKWYVRDGDEFAEQIEDIIIEREGYLHGKKIIGTSDESDVESTTSGSTQATGQGAPPAGVCPFTGVQRGMEGLKVGEGSASSKPSGEEAAPPQ